MERPTSEKVALLERVLNRIRENARDSAGRARFMRPAPESKKGAPAPHPLAPAFLSGQAPDATPLSAAAAVSPPLPPVAVASPPAPPAVVSPPAPPVVASPPAPPVVASPPAPPVVASPPAPPVASPRPPIAAFSPAVPPVRVIEPLVEPLPFASSVPPPERPPSAQPPQPLQPLSAAFEPVEKTPPSSPTRVVTERDLAEMQAALLADSPQVAPGRARTTQALFDQPEELPVNVAFDAEALARPRSSPPPAPPSAPDEAPPAEADAPKVITGVHPIASSVGGPRQAPGPFGSAPIEVDLASTIELPAAELASAVQSSSGEEKPAPASSPRLRSSPTSVVDDDTYPAVSPSSLPPLYEGAISTSLEPSLTESQVGVRPPSVSPYDEARLPSDLPLPPLRRSELPRAPAASYHPEAEPAAAAAAAEPQAVRMVVPPAPPAIPAPAPQPRPAPLDAFTLEADSFGRTAVQGSAANFVSAARGASPRTFGELLDASLSLGEDL